MDLLALVLGSKATDAALDVAIVSRRQTLLLLQNQHLLMLRLHLLIDLIIVYAHVAVTPSSVRLLQQ